MTALSRAAQQAARRFADQQSARIAAAGGSVQFVATVTTVTAGAAAGGRPLVKVQWRGQETTASGYADTYNPVVGHRVKCSLLPGGLLFVDYRISGQPLEED